MKVKVFIKFFEVFSLKFLINLQFWKLLQIFIKNIIKKNWNLAFAVLRRFLNKIALKNAEICEIHRSPQF